MNHEARLAAQARIESTLDNDERRIVARLKHMNSQHVGSLREPKLRARYRKLIRNTQLRNEKLAGLVVTGESGSGKTHLIRAMENHPAFQPYHEPGEPHQMLPYISIDAPPKGGPAQVLAEIIRACGFDMVKADGVPAMLDLAYKWLAKRRVMFVHIDEFQHALRTSTPGYIKEAQDMVKELIQISAPWPVQIILSGTSALNVFRTTHDELRTRTLPFNLDSLTPTGNLKLALKIAHGVIAKHAELTCKKLFVDGEPAEGPSKVKNELADPWVVANADFANRLLKAANFQFGNVIQIVRLACEEVIIEGRQDVRMADLGAAYSLLVGEIPTDKNMFLSPHWQQLEIPRALVDGNAFEELRKKRSKKVASVR